MTTRAIREARPAVDRTELPDLADVEEGGAPPQQSDERGVSPGWTGSDPEHPVNGDSLDLGTLLTVRLNIERTQRPSSKPGRFPGHGTGGTLIGAARFPRKVGTAELTPAADSFARLLRPCEPAAAARETRPHRWAGLRWRAVDARIARLSITPRTESPPPRPREHADRSQDRRAAL